MKYFVSIVVFLIVISCDENDGPNLSPFTIDNSNSDYTVYSFFNNPYKQKNVQSEYNEDYANQSTFAIDLDKDKEVDITFQFTHSCFYYYFFGFPCNEIGSVEIQDGEILSYQNLPNDSTDEETMPYPNPFPAASGWDHIPQTTMYFVFPLTKADFNGLGFVQPSDYPSTSHFYNDALSPYYFDYLNIFIREATCQPDCDEAFEYFAYRRKNANDDWIYGAIEYQGTADEILISRIFENKNPNQLLKLTE